MWVQLIIIMHDNLGRDLPQYWLHSRNQSLFLLLPVSAFQCSLHYLSLFFMFCTDVVLCVCLHTVTWIMHNVHLSKASSRMP